MNKKLVLEKVRKLKNLWDHGQIKRLEIHEVYPNLPLDDITNVLYFTLPVSLNFQRSSPAMWKSAFETFNDPETNYLFYPEKVVKTERTKVQRDLHKHRLSLQINKHTDVWISLSQTFLKYDGDPRKFFAIFNNDVELIIKALRKEYKKDFPFLSGAKMSSYWIFILSKFTDIKFNNLQKISIIPDTHVLQASVKLGITKEIENPEKVAQLWFELLENTEITPVEMHPILWNWSRANFTPEV